MFPRPVRTLGVACVIGIAAIAAIFTACTERKPVPGPAPAKTAAPQASASPEGAAEPRDAGTASQAAAPKEDAGAAVDGPFIGALYMQTPVMSDMEWAKEDRKPNDRSGSVRLGYIRQGSRVPVIPEAHPKSNCKEGWYEIVQGGFVCGKYATLDLNHPRIKYAPHPPDTVSSLPYDYGYNVTNGTPLYRQIPSREERARLEPWLAPRKPKPRMSEDETAQSDLDAGASALSLTRTIATESSDGDALDAGVPWYLRDYDGGKPQITLDELKGEGPIARRMVKGFYLALDKDFTSNGARWWRTTSGLIAPFDRIYVNKTPSEFHGLWFDASAESNGKAPQVGIVLSTRARKYALSASRKAVTTGESIPRQTVVRLTGDSVTINGAAYDETGEGYWMRASDGIKTKPGDPPKDLAPNEKWIDVNLTSQTLVAFEGDRAVFATAVSTGKKNYVDKEKDHRTPTGSFRIREKHIAATMDGDVASDGPYSLEDVPWIMYFNGSYALHGAFWHNNFGRTQSHGCVNLAPMDAKALFGWSEPKMPEGWHGVMSTSRNPGTRVVVHD
ncbi:MAG: L,D-transpeptidase [Polyangiaceae bacterium]|nr:L,D-transpeptidase [Polyangiaceae bacterium]